VAKDCYLQSVRRDDVTKSYSLPLRQVLLPGPINRLPLGAGKRKCYAKTTGSWPVAIKTSLQKTLPGAALDACSLAYEEKERRERKI